MIPWDGVDLFNTLVVIVKRNIWKQYGGILYESEEESGWSGSGENIYKRRKSCLRNKCNKKFGTKYVSLTNILIPC